MMEQLVVDGVPLDTSGDFRVIRVDDSWYVVGQDVALRVKNMDVGYDLIEALEKALVLPAYRPTVESIHTSAIVKLQDNVAELLERLKAIDEVMDRLTRKRGL